MKKNHKKKKAKDGDYISYIPNMVKNKFERKKYPGLFQELDKWEHEKDEIVKNLQEETTKEDCKGSSKRFNTKRSCKKTKIIRKFD